MLVRLKREGGCPNERSKVARWSFCQAPETKLACRADGWVIADAPFHQAKRQQDGAGGNQRPDQDSLGLAEGDAGFRAGDSATGALLLFLVLLILLLLVATLAGDRGGC